MRQTAGLRKSAILLSSLPLEQSQAVLAQLDEPTASQVRREMGSLGQIPPDEQSAVIEEFRRTVGAACEPLPENVDDADPIAEIEPAELMEQLHDQHPQTVAAVLSMLPAETSGRCLAALPVQRQIDLFCRINAIRPLNVSVRDELNGWLKTIAPSWPRDVHEAPLEPTLLARVLDDALRGGGCNETGSDS